MKRWVWFGAMSVAVSLLSPGAAAGQGGGDPYPHGPLPEGLGCADCHSTQGWSPLDPNRSFDHQEVTGFALAGRHAGAACSLCHQDLRFSALDVPLEDCGSCHLDVHQGTLSTDCTSCHTPEGFSVVSGIRIHQATAFPLEGAHLQLACESCHATDRGGAYSPLPSDCMACHQEDFEAPKVLDHVALGFPEDCLSCHTPISWNDVADFDHVTFSGGYELQGVHGELPCSGCHLPGGGLRFPVPAGPQDCYSCHQADYQRKHGGEGYPTTCSLCHSQTSWEGADDDHAVLSNGFVLEGAHQELSCTGCHVPGGTESLFHPAGPQDCVACHQADYQREHTGSGYPTACATCHLVTGWEGAQMDHAALAEGFVLEGAHGELACASCHTADGSGNLFQPAGPDDCVSCHQDDYQREHAGSGYPVECRTCHTVSVWTDVTADHESLSNGFVLVGNHGQLDCSSCHLLPGMESIFSPADAEDCLACHLADFQREHAGTGYPGTCLTCHVVTTWEGAQADHAALSDGFVLEGAHTGLACVSCHTADLSGTLFQPNGSDDCVSCHQDDYQREHSGSGYPTDCLTCHTATSWSAAEFNHDGAFFPIYSGSHQGRWSDCSNCHTDPTNLGTFTCLSCHEHNKTETDARHSGVRDYVYESGQCYSCHPTGRSGG